MHTLSQRANTLFAFFVTVLFSVLGAVAISGPLLLWRVPIDANSVDLSVEAVSVKMGRLGYYYDYSSPMTEVGLIQFNLDADLTSLWNWNTKQLFLYVVAEYETPSHNVNQIVIWDDIITSKEDAIVTLRNKKAEYIASDMSHKLAGIRTNLSLHWNIVPNVGLLMTQRAGSAPLTFPRASQ
ncbi:hypothetical protein SpCBS45565_g08094 [Spizellomyces sp. 'palustris']|nr:hypothetical protein SpCBS45565_g08094 [Spizellomyces sp. 'palustris']